MRAAALIPLVMVVFAITSAAVSLGDAISRYINRAPYVLGVPNVGREPLRGMVPKGERLGFLSDRSDPGVTGRRMYAAIYTLAPFMVDNTPYRRFVVGDFQNVSASQPRLSRYGLRLVADLGNGFWLLAAAE